MNRKLSSQRLDPGKFDSLAENSFTLPASWYYDSDVFELERDRIFNHHWNYQCHISQIPNPGDFQCGSVGDQSIIVMRGTDNEIRAFYNVCSHRAHPLLQGAGSTRLIVCPYHQWSYSSDGCFQGARGRDTLKDWIPDNADLKPVRVESWGGLVFVNLDPAAEPLRPQSEALLHDLENNIPELEDLVFFRRYEIEVAANWKTIIDNNHECYHCNMNHPGLMVGVDYACKADWSDQGITFTHKVHDDPAGDLESYPWKPSGLKQFSLFGYIWPNTIPLCFPGQKMLSIFQVIPTGPETARERWDFFAPVDMDKCEGERFVQYIQDTLIPEDSGLCESVQKGLHSHGYHQGRFVVDRNNPDFSEHHVHFFQSMVRDSLLD